MSSDFEVGAPLGASHGPLVHTLLEFCAREKIVSLDSMLKNLISAHFLEENHGRLH